MRSMVEGYARVIATPPTRSVEFYQKINRAAFIKVAAMIAAMAHNSN
ncbi:MAG: hypothetical protein ACKOQ3_00975 [Novosphingobium sp.]